MIHNMNLVLSYALALRIMLANLRRKFGVLTRVAFTMEELGFRWPSDQGIFSPSAVLVWLREQVGCAGDVSSMPEAC